MFAIHFLICLPTLVITECYNRSSLKYNAARELKFNLFDFLIELAIIKLNTKVQISMMNK